MLTRLSKVGYLYPNNSIMNNEFYWNKIEDSTV